MKKTLRLSGLALLIALLAYYLPKVVAAHGAVPLNGIFDVQLKCMGGHEIFLELAGTEAFENCPGHRDRHKVGDVLRDVNSATVLDPRDGRPWFRIEWDGTKHSLSFLKTPDSQSTLGMIPLRGEVKQVTDPWRLQLPRFLPDE